MKKHIIGLSVILSFSLAGCLPAQEPVTPSGMQPAIQNATTPTIGITNTSGTKVSSAPNETLIGAANTTQPRSPNETSNQTSLYTLNVNVNPPGTGTVFPNGGKFPYGTQVVLNATPAAGYMFSHWTGSRGESFGGNPLIVILPSDNLTAEFVPAEPPPWPDIPSYVDDNNLTINITSGQEFVIALPYTSRLTADWIPSFNETMVALIDKKITNDNPGGQKWFLFKALTPGVTQIIMKYGMVQTGAYSEQRTYTVNIK